MTKSMEFYHLLTGFYRKSTSLLTKSQIRWKKSQREEIRTAQRLLSSLTESKTNIFFTHSFKIVRNFMTGFKREMFLFRKILTGQQEPSTVSGLDIKLSNPKF